MPRGGRRVGAGRKPKVAPGAVVLGMDGRRQDAGDLLTAAGQAAVLTHPPELLATPPRDLSAAQKKVWRQAAPLAIAERTLTPATIPGFRQLVARWVRVEELSAKMDELGVASDLGLQLLQKYTALSQRLDASLQQFNLTGLGKPSASAPARPAARNPWAEVKR